MESRKRSILHEFGVLGKERPGKVMTIKRCFGRKNNRRGHFGRRFDRGRRKPRGKVLGIFDFEGVVRGESYSGDHLTTKILPVRFQVKKEYKSLLLVN